MSQSPPFLAPYLLPLAVALNFWVPTQLSDGWDLLRTVLTLALPALATHVLTRFQLAHPSRAALAITVAIAWFTHHRTFQDAVLPLATTFPALTALLRTRYLIAFTALATLAALYLILASKKNLHRTLQTANITTALLAAFAAYSAFSRHQLFRQLSAPPALTIPVAFNTQIPDVYYIVLDAYTSPESLLTHWNHNSSNSTASLRKLDFQILTNAHSNYRRTYHCIASTFRMDYLPPAPLRNSAAFQYVLPKVLQKAFVPNFFSRLGYQLINLAPIPLGPSPAHYRYFDADPSLLTTVLNRSILGLWTLRDHRIPDINLQLFKNARELARSSDPSVPRFVYLHPLLPHYPYAFDRHGNRLPHAFGRTQDRDARAYLEQLQFADQLLQTTLSDILTHSRRPTVIIVQGDHGFRVLEGPHRDAESFTILHALRLPGAPPAEIPAGHTPVNTFRLLLNRYFNARLPRVPDHSIRDDSSSPSHD